MMLRQARRFSAIQHDPVRCGLHSRRSYVAPSPPSRSAAKPPRKELTYCPICGFKPCVICMNDLTPALFCCLQPPPARHRTGGQTTATHFFMAFLRRDRVRGIERLRPPEAPWRSWHGRPCWQRAAAFPSTRYARRAGGRATEPRFPMPGWLLFLCGLVALVAAAYLLYAVLRPESF